MPLLLYQAVIDSPLGKLGIKTNANQLVGIDYVSEKTKLLTPADTLSKIAATQLEKYFKNSSYVFTIPLQLNVSEFAQNVLTAMQKIAVGKTCSYSDIAKQLQTSPRPVGNACRHNPIPIIIPCHRVVAKCGMGGYNGETKGKMLAIKQWLLNHEKNNE